ncbi:MAG: cytochrome c biogenesis protein CcdA [Cellulosilyticaceae bacterium]
MENINYIVVFLEGLISFLSPCVLPILPVYLAVLSRSQNNEMIDARSKKKVMLRNTILFVLGISTTFFILGIGIGVFRTFLLEYKRYLLMGGGVFILVMGFFYIGDLNIPFLQRERRVHYQVKAMNPFVAYLLGLTFSFGWTPCIGPMLASVLVLASTRADALQGNLLIGTYTLGFIIPFIIVAIFSDKMMSLLDRVKLKGDLIKKIGGYILIVMGFFVLVGGIRIPKFVKPQVTTEQTTPEAQKVEEPTTGEVAEEEPQVIMAPDFTLQDQYGNTHTLSEYKGKTVFLNFWATWCPPCKAEMPHIEEIYKEYGLNEEEVVILGVAFPNRGKEKSAEDIAAFLEKEGYTFPTVMDEEGVLAYYYGISAFPTTFLINPQGEVEGYWQGAMAKEDMVRIIEQVKNK